MRNMDTPTAQKVTWHDSSPIHLVEPTNRPGRYILMCSGQSVGGMLPVEVDENGITCRKCREKLAAPPSSYR